MAETVDELARRLIALLTPAAAAAEKPQTTQVREFTAETPSASDALPHDVARAQFEQDFAERARALEEASRTTPHAVRLGFSNKPHDCRIWGSDWREHLPDGHPAKVAAINDGTFVVMGSRRDLENLQAAHRALGDLDVSMNSRT